MATTTLPKGLRALRKANMAAGRFWFSEDTLRYFGTEFHGDTLEGPGGVFFVTSSQPPHGPRLFSVHEAREGGVHIDTVGDFCGFKYSTDALIAANEFSQLGVPEDFDWNDSGFPGNAPIRRNRGTQPALGRVQN